MPSEDSSRDECKCHHAREHHANGTCVKCQEAGFDVLSNHGFIGPQPCEHPNRQFTGSTSGGGLPTKLHYTCLEPHCKERFTVEESIEEARLRHHRDCEDCDVLDPCPCCGLRFAVKEQPYVWHSDGSRCEDTAACGRFHAQEQPAEQAEPGPNCSEIEGCDGECCARAEPVPPQPERRPPYAVAYSAGGHAYEVLLPGDAVVSAVDGRLVIEHQGFPVLAIERVMPVAVQKGASSE